MPTNIKEELWYEAALVVTEDQGAYENVRIRFHGQWLSLIDPDGDLMVFPVSGVRYISTVTRRTPETPVIEGVITG